MIKMAFVITCDEGREYRYERYARSTSIADAMLAEDSAIRAFTAAFKQNPSAVRRIV